MRAIVRKGGAVLTASVGTALYVLDQIGRAEYATGFMEAWKRYLPTAYIACFIVALLIVRAQSARPRLVLGYEDGRGVDPETEPPPTFGHRPLFLRNSGDSTAINITVSGGRDGWSFAGLDPLEPGSEGAVRIYHDHGKALHATLFRFFLGELEADAKAVDRSKNWRVERREVFRVDYQDYERQKYYAEFAVIGEADQAASGIRIELLSSN